MKIHSKTLAICVVPLLAGIAIASFTGHIPSLNSRLAAQTDDWFNKTGSYTGWRNIVIHHSATDSGSADAFHRYHTNQGWGGLSYHFVIGNGKGASDGEIQEGFRWKQQITGTHVSVNSWDHNIFGIGICLVGNFEKSAPTSRQWTALVNLTSDLVKKHNIPLEKIITHRQVPYDDNPTKTEQTACPGSKFPLERLRADVAKKLKSKEARKHQRL